MTSEVRFAAACVTIPLLNTPCCRSAYSCSGLNDNKCALLADLCDRMKESSPCITSLCDPCDSRDSTMTLNNMYHSWQSNESAITSGEPDLSAYACVPEFEPTCVTACCNLTWVSGDSGLDSMVSPSSAARAEDFELVKAASLSSAVVIANDTKQYSHGLPLLWTAEMEDWCDDEEDDEVVICMDGVDVHSAWKTSSWKNSAEEYTWKDPYAQQQPIQEAGKSFTMYKRVDRKVKPVPAVFPEDARVTRQIPTDPLVNLPPLPFHPPQFQECPGDRLTQERLEELKINPEQFLWPEEEKLFIHILKLNQNYFVFEDNQRGSFREDYFSPYVIPVVPHIPWAFPNIPIPPGIKDKVVELLKEKIAAGVYEPSQSSYRSRWFCVMKKSGKLRLVHDLQPLNKVTIRDAGLPPNLDNFVEPFAGRQCYTVFDLYWGFDARKVHPRSRDMTAFLTPLGLLRITSLPTGFTNSPAEFQACMAYILQEEIPHKADIFIDDLPIKGPETNYPDKYGNPETLKENPGIRRFIWEHAQDVHRIVHRVGQAGGTFSPSKVQLCLPKVLIVGQTCTPQGRLPDEQKIAKILSWPTLKTVKDVRGFLGLCGTVRIWIKNYSALARPLTELVRNDVEFEWNERREEAFNTLKLAITSPPALRPVDYTSSNPVVLSVDSSYIAVGFILSQYDEDKRKRPARYGSIPMNEREARYSQPKLELYGLYRALRAYRLYLIGVQNFQVEVDAKYIKGMLNEPDLQPNATMNRWIQGILLFDFELIHVPAERHKGPDALSRKELAENEAIPDEDDDWLDDIALFISHGQEAKASPAQQLPLQGFPININAQEETLTQIFRFLTTLQLPEDRLTAQQRKRFIQRAQKFFVKDGAMFKRNGPKMPLKVIFRPIRRKQILVDAHEKLGHRGEQAVMQTCKQRFFWPYMWQDIRQHVRSCHECQIRSTRKAEVPITISTPSTIFLKLHVDVMFMPRAKGFKFIVAARDNLSGAAEGRALKHNNADQLSKFFWEEILCRYGAIGQVVTDNGAEVQKAFTKLMNRYGIPKISISPYNSKANGVVERGHFTIREAILKSCKKVSEWPDYVSHAFFADKVTVRRATGFSPYFLLYGTLPVLPLDLTEASFLIDDFHQGMSTAELLAARIRQLQKKPEDLAAAAEVLKKSRLRSKEQFERRFRTRLIKDSLETGTLVLIRNTRVEKEMNKKHKPRYLGPYEVVRRTAGGSYVIKELDGAVHKQGYAAFRLIPYISRHSAQLQILAQDDPEESDIEDEANNELSDELSEESHSTDSSSDVDDE